MTRLLCDEMLGGLARWLRAAGYDTDVAAAGDRDADLLDRAPREERIFITRDVALASAASRAVEVLLLTEGSFEGQATMVARALDLDWLCAPFSRCLIDNALLRAAEPEELARIPERARDLPGPFRACPACAAYWPGSHVRRMMVKLKQWQAAAVTQMESCSPRPDDDPPTVYRDVQHQPKP